MSQTHGGIDTDVDSVEPQRRSGAFRWRIATPLAFLCAGVLFVGSAVASGGTDLRASRYTDLGDIATSEAVKLAALREEQARLAEDVDELTEDLAANAPDSVLDFVEGLRGPAGMQAVHGPGVTVTLMDAPETIQDTFAGEDFSNLVVHEQDIQGVVNALWGGGAEAMTIQGQRVVSTTAIRCVGSTVVLHDVPYAPPYVISAIGTVDGMLDNLSANASVAWYLQRVDEFQLGWLVEIEPDIVAAAYTGSTTLQHARAGGRRSDNHGDP